MEEHMSDVVCWPLKKLNRETDDSENVMGTVINVSL